MDKLNEFYLSDDEIDYIKKGWAYVMDFDDEGNLVYAAA